MENLKIFIIAGEISGDLLASEIIKNLQITYKHNLTIKGIAGKHLKKQGVTTLFPQEELSIMGFFEVIPAIPRIIKRINDTVRAIISFKPNIVITVDSPDFNFRVIKKLTRLKFNTSKFIHIVAPTVWAYREKRAKKVSQLYDLLLVLLPFEPPYFTKYGLNTKFIGHPIIYKNFVSPKQDVLKKYNINNNDNIITLTLGSRTKEIKQLSTIYKAALKKLSHTNNNIVIIIPTFTKYIDFFNSWVKDLPFNTIITTDESEKLAFFKISDFVIAKSGTNTIEIAKQETAFMVCYKVSMLTYLLLKFIVKTKYVNLLNIFANKEIVPEYIQYQCTADNIYNQAKKYLNNQDLVKSQIKKQNQYIKKFLNNHNTDPAIMATTEILAQINRHC